MKLIPTQWIFQIVSHVESSLTSGVPNRPRKWWGLSRKSTQHRTRASNSFAGCSDWKVIRDFVTTPSYLEMSYTTTSIGSTDRPASARNMLEVRPEDQQHASIMTRQAEPGWMLHQIHLHSVVDCWHAPCRGWSAQTVPIEVEGATVIRLLRPQPVCFGRSIVSAFSKKNQQLWDGGHGLRIQSGMWQVSIASANTPEEHGPWNGQKNSPIRTGKPIPWLQGIPFQMEQYFPATTIFLCQSFVSQVNQRRREQRATLKEQASPTSGYSLQTTVRQVAWNHACT